MAWFIPTNMTYVYMVWFIPTYFVQLLQLTFLLHPPPRLLFTSSRSYSLPIYDSNTPCVTFPVAVAAWKVSYACSW